MLKYSNLEKFELTIRRENFSNPITKIGRKIENLLKDKDCYIICFKDWNNNEKPAVKNDRRCIFIYSNPSIEYWFLLHYEEANRSFGEKELKGYIKKYINGYSTNENFLKKDTWVKELLNHMDNAYQRSKKYKDKTLSFTEFYKLIELIEPES
ncbi:MAG: RloB family protein [Elusimicrobiota bacterium]